MYSLYFYFHYIIIYVAVSDTSPLPRRLPNKAPNLQGDYRPRIRYIDPRLTPKVKDISSNKGSRHRGRGVWYNSIRIGLRLGEISLQSTTITQDVDTSLFTELLIPHHRCCPPSFSHQAALHVSPIPKSHSSIVTSL